MHRQGKKHINAETLSRLPENQEPGTEEETSHTTAEEPAVVPGADVNLQDDTNSTYLAQQEDSAIGPVLTAMEHGSYPEPDTVSSWSRDSRLLVQQWEQLEIHDQLLWRRFYHPDSNRSHLQLIVPSALRHRVLDNIHGGAVSGHFGQRKMVSQLRRNFYWPGLTIDVKNLCRTCATCAARKTPIPRRQANLHTVPSGYPMQVVAVDILGPLPEMPSGNRYILVAADYFTRWTEAYAIHNQEAITVAKKLVDEMFLRFSPPSQLHSDQGASKLMSNVCSLLGIHKSRTTAYHPQCDGLVERFNRTLLSMLATCAQQHSSSWEIISRKYVLLIILANIQLLATVHSSLCMDGKQGYQLTSCLAPLPWRSSCLLTMLWNYNLYSVRLISGFVTTWISLTSDRRNSTIGECMANPTQSGTLRGF